MAWCPSVCGWCFGFFLLVGDSRMVTLLGPGRRRLSWRYWHFAAYFRGNRCARRDRELDHSGESTIALWKHVVAYGRKIAICNWVYTEGEMEAGDDERAALLRLCTAAVGPQHLGQLVFRWRR